MKKIVAIFAASLLPLMASATNNIPVSNNLKSKNGLASYITSLAVWFQGILFALAVLVELYAAFMFVTAAGNEDKIKSAKNAALGGAVVIAIAILAFIVYSLVSSVLA
jgi:hypothetical protein